jgi:transcriptional regulator with XRE-family HTH domain
MSNAFSLLSLHFSIDKHPRSWVMVKGEKISSIIRKLEKEIIKDRNLTRESLSRELAQKLNCSTGVIKRILQGKTEFYPIPIILGLIQMGGKRKYISQIEGHVTFLKINSASAKPIRAVRKLTNDLAKIIGAFMADGSLSVQTVIETPHKAVSDKIKKKIDYLQLQSTSNYSTARQQYNISLQVNPENIKIISDFQESTDFHIQTHYNIDLTDEYRDNVEAFNRWVQSVFAISPTNFHKRGNAWRTIFSNKILARYFMHFFNIIPGHKTYTAFEPDCIKKSSLMVRKSFARGVLMFDGCVNKAGKIFLSSKSQKLVLSIKEIWKLDNISQGKMAKNKRNEWLLYTTTKNECTRLANYFETNTQKWKLLYWINGKENLKPIIKNDVNLSTIKITTLLKEIKSCDMSFLEKYFKKRYTSIRYYLNILRNHGLIRISCTPRIWSNYIDDRTTVYLDKSGHDKIFDEIKGKFGLEKNISTLLGVHKGTFSAWKRRKNRIQIKILKQLCSLLNINFEDITKNIIQTDRDIIEFI